VEGPIWPGIAWAIPWPSLRRVAGLKKKLTCSTRPSPARPIARTPPGRLRPSAAAPPVLAAFPASPSPDPRSQIRRSPIPMYGNNQNQGRGRGRRIGQRARGMFAICQQLLIPFHEFYFGFAVISNTYCCLITGIYSYFTCSGQGGPSTHGSG
jgi:hypothetical protein